jgi:hypothetical protein
MRHLFDTMADGPDDLKPARCLLSGMPSATRYEACPSLSWWEGLAAREELRPQEEVAGRQDMRQAGSCGGEIGMIRRHRVAPLIVSGSRHTRGRRSGSFLAVRHCAVAVWPSRERTRSRQRLSSLRRFGFYSLYGQERCRLAASSPILEPSPRRGVGWATAGGAGAPRNTGGGLSPWR